mgnify:FL=1
MQKARTVIGALLLVGLSLSGWANAQAVVPDALSNQAPAQIDLGLSMGVSPTEVRLEQILSGEKQVSLSPIVSNEFSIIGRPQVKHWLRMKVAVPANAEPMILSFERQGVRSISLYQVDKSGKKISVIPLQSSRTPHLENTRGQWPTRIVFLLPPAIADGTIIYAEIESLGYLHLRPALLNSEQQTKLSASDDSF